MIKEDFLQYLWRFQLLRGNIATTLGLSIYVKNQGLRNSDSGPDFLNARIVIGETEWAGNVEIHVHASSWYDHGHHDDPSYDNVILHVVLVNDQQVFRRNGEPIPTLVCDGLLDIGLVDRYSQLMNSRLWVPCARIIKYTPGIVVSSWLSTMMIERLHLKAGEMESTLWRLQNDWEETFYRFLVRSLGLKINIIPFEMLAASLPYKILAKHSDHPDQLEALLFGQAGFLAGSDGDDYTNKLRAEYLFLKGKYALEPMDKSIWKFMRLRPPAFPTVRIAILARLIANYSNLFSKVLEAESPEQLYQLFNASSDAYWAFHHHFGVVSARSFPKQLGKQSIDLILINLIVPMLFLYGRYHQSEKFTERALRFLEGLPAEENVIIHKWKGTGLEVNDAFYSQALLHLKKHYCDNKKCLDCRIGNELLRKSDTVIPQ